MTISNENPISAANLKAVVQAQSAGGGSGSPLKAIPSDRMDTSAPIYCGSWEIGTNASNGIFRIGGCYNDEFLYIGTVHTSSAWTANSSNYIYVRKGSSDAVACSGETALGSLPTPVFDGISSSIGSMDVFGNQFFPESAFAKNSLIALNCFFYQEEE